MTIGTIRTVVVTGSASGVGAATAAAARHAGLEVIGVDRHAAEVCVDLATSQGRAELVDAVGDLSQGVVDAVIACAGVSSQTVVAVNFFGMVATLQGLRPLLGRSTQARAVAVASLASINPVDQATVDSVSGRR